MSDSDARAATAPLPAQCSTSVDLERFYFAFSILLVRMPSGPPIRLPRPPFFPGGVSHLASGSLAEYSAGERAAFELGYKSGVADSLRVIGSGLAAVNFIVVCLLPRYATTYPHQRKTGNAPPTGASLAVASFSCLCYSTTPDISVFVFFAPGFPVFTPAYGTACGRGCVHFGT